jgi:transcriptional regulator with PAS, ATPase and Fis domain
MNKAKKNVLVSWIGATDLDSTERAGELSGPIASAINAVHFDALELIYNYPDERVAPYMAHLLKDESKCSIYARKANVNSPIDYREIYLAADKLLSELETADISLSILLSPGTPTMQAVWVLLGKTRFPCTFYQASKEQGVQEVDIPFRLTAEYLPTAAQLNKLELSSLMASGVEPDAAFDDILSSSPVMHQLKVQAQILATHELPVLITGETGTGKELFAKAIHQASLRREQPFIVLNCGAFSTELIDSLLFGHKKGAFTGAIADKPGAFEQAHNGTLFLDEFGELDSAAQVRLLRVLQDGKYTPLGDTKERHSNFRLITATNKNLIEQVANGLFREDLFYRVAIGVIQLPPLRKRGDDLAHIADRLLANIALEYPTLNGKYFSQCAKKFINEYRWPGNVRELKATITRAALWSVQNGITEEDIRKNLFRTETEQAEFSFVDVSDGIDLNSILSSIEKHYIESALAFTAGNKRRAAKLLGLNSHQTLSNRIKTLSIKSDD